VQKVIAYITHGEDLLVFEEPDFPEAGMQVPGGTLESQELPAAGVMREAAEETGLQQLRLVRSLGTVRYAPGSGKEVSRHFFHLLAGERKAEAWDHWESSPSSGGPPIRFRCRWLPLRKAPPLVAELDCLLNQLVLGMERAAPRESPVQGTARDAARVLLFDPRGRLLLLHAQLEGRRFWVTPGGGLERGEDFCSAALRELGEEVGSGFDLGPAVWSRRHIHESAGTLWDVAERFFVGRAHSSEVQPRRPDPYITGFRWWTLAELQSSREDFAPRSLPGYLAAVLEGRYPSQLIDVGV
jgi:8-oxo-dGTP pyrophosphatase MutT (NUDIX family)